MATLSFDGRNLIGQRIFELESGNGNLDEQKTDKQIELHHFQKKFSYDYNYNTFYKLCLSNCGNLVLKAVTERDLHARDLKDKKVHVYHKVVSNNNLPVTTRV